MVDVEPGNRVGDEIRYIKKILGGMQRHPNRARSSGSGRQNRIHQFAIREDLESKNIVVGVLPNGEEKSDRRQLERSAAATCDRYD
jgi:hypothetical protein